MASKRPTTTIKVSRRLMRHIEGAAKPGESVDETLKRLLKLIRETKQKVTFPPPLTTTIKVSRMVMDYIQDEAKPGESRDHTLSRLLHVEQDNGNVSVRGK